MHNILDVSRIISEVFPQKIQADIVCIFQMLWCLLEIKDLLLSLVTLNTVW